MSPRPVILALLLFLGWPTAAEAGRMPYPRVLHMHYGTAMPEGCVAAGCATPDTGEVWLPARPRPFAAAHEVGHVFFHETLVAFADIRPDLAGRFRAELTRLLGFPAGTDWYASDEWYENPYTGRAPPDEVAADAYAACDLGMMPRITPGKRSFRWIDGHGYLPSLRKHVRVCNTIAVIGLVYRSSAGEH